MKKIWIIPHSDEITVGMLKQIIDNINYKGRIYMENSNLEENIRKYGDY